MQRRCPGQDLLLHEADQGTAQDQEQISRLPSRVDLFLEERLDIGALLRQIRVFIDEKNDPFLLRLLADKTKKILKAMKTDIACQIGRQGHKDRLRHHGQQLRFLAFDGGKGNALTVMLLDELVHEHGLSDSPSAIQNSHHKPALPVLPVEDLQFRVTSPEYFPHPALPSAKINFAEIHFAEIHFGEIHFGYPP